MPISFPSENLSFTEIIYRSLDYTIHIITTEDQVAHLTFTTDRHLAAVKALASTHTIHKENSAPAPAPRIRHQLKEYLSGRSRLLELEPAPLFLNRATPFQQRVWPLLAAIPYGHTRTYGELARELGNPGLARAVGRACHANPLALLIPCHRVVGNRGLCGFAGGTSVKEKLLRLEQRQTVR